MHSPKHIAYIPNALIPNPKQLLADLSESILSIPQPEILTTEETFTYSITENKNKGNFQSVSEIIDRITNPLKVITLNINSNYIFSIILQN